MITTKQLEADLAANNLQGIRAALCAHYDKLELGSIEQGACKSDIRRRTYDALLADYTPAPATLVKAVAMRWEEWDRKSATFGDVTRFLRERWSKPSRCKPPKPEAEPEWRRLRGNE